MTTDNYGNECAGELEAQLAQGEWQPVIGKHTYVDEYGWIRLDFDGDTLTVSVDGIDRTFRLRLAEDERLCRRVARPAQNAPQPDWSQAPTWAQYWIEGIGWWGPYLFEYDDCSRYDLPAGATATISRRPAGQGGEVTGE